jgi:DNA-binding CsgD family transcriptional regulator/sugar lactone lactonase YvrE
MQLRRGRPPHPEPVTPAEAKVLELVRMSLPNAEIAVRLGISVNTVRYHVSNLLSKAGVEDRDALKRWKEREPSNGRRWSWLGWPAWAVGGSAVVAAVAIGGWFASRAASSSPAVPTFPRYDVSVFAGDGSFGSKDGKGTEASFRDPRGIAVDANGNVYVTEVWNACIREIAPDRTVSTLAALPEPDVSDHGSCEISSRDGSSSIVAMGAALYTLHGIGSLFQYVPGFTAIPVRLMRVADLGTNSATGPAVWTFDVALDGSFVLPDMSGNRILRWDRGAASVIAGAPTGGYRDGPAAVAQFLQPMGVAVQSDGGIYVSDTRNHVIRFISPNGNVSTVAGTTVVAGQDGPAGKAAFSDPGALALDSAGSLWISDNAAGTVRVLSNGYVFTVVTGLQLGNYPGIAAAPDGSVYVVESGANRILKLTPAP